METQKKPTSRFAVSEDIFTKPFDEINQQLLKLTREHELIDHNEINSKRFPEWFSKVTTDRSFYGSRFWEYPFAILAANLTHGMKCADIGCGSTPFTPFLCSIAGHENVTGFDPDYVKGDAERHLSFGARQSHIDKFKFNFFPDSFAALSAGNDTFDRVFCISVLEHVQDPEVKQHGLQEMVRVLKPGGRMILTFDTGLDILLNPILRIIELTGLVPVGELDLRWPVRRFVNYEKSNVDVFGLVLEKPSGTIFKDYDCKHQIPAHDATMQYVRHANWYNVPYNLILKARDLNQRWGPLRVMAKEILKRY